jgi:hypothetical protein
LYQSVPTSHCHPVQLLARDPEPYDISSSHETSKVAGSRAKSCTG